MAIELLERETDRSTIVRKDRVAEPGPARADTVDPVERTLDLDRVAAEAGGEPAAAYWCCGIECC